MRHPCAARFVSESTSRRCSRNGPASTAGSSRRSAAGTTCRAAALSALLLLSASLSGHTLDTGVTLSVPRDTLQGSPFNVSLEITGENPESVDFYLVDSEGQEQISIPAAAFRSHEGDIVWANVLGTSSTATPGEWMVRARAHFDRYSIEVKEPVSIDEGDFFSMTITLGRELTALLTEPDPRRQEEREELNRLLASSDREAVFNPGVFVMPVVDPNRTSAGFGDRRIYEYHGGRTSRSVHHGIDYAAPTGTETLAAGHGVVRLAADRLVSGKSVVIEHLPGVFSLYYHLDSIAVDEGDFVMAGDRIGEIGATGLATGAHLHWEVRIGGVAVDPEWFLSSPAVDTHEHLTKLGP